MKTYKLKIAAGSFQYVDAVGNFVSIIEPTTAQIRVKTDGANGVDLKIEQGQSANIGRFNRLRFQNENQVEQEIVVAVGEGQLNDSRTRGEVSIAANSAAVGLAPVTVSGAATIAGNLSRVRLDVYADEANTGPIYIGSNSSTAGMPLQAGGVYQLPITSDLDVYCAVTGVLHVLEVV